MKQAQTLVSVDVALALCEDATQTDRCSNRCGLRIFFIPLSGENPETKANAFAFPRVVPSAPLFKRDTKFLLKNNKKQKGTEGDFGTVGAIASA
ncbi:hypothetical protein D3C73_1043370 [compost metagenome]